MALPLTDQFRHEQWRRLITSAGPADLEGLRKLALSLLDYATAHRGLALQLLDPIAKAPAAEAAGAMPSAGDQNSSS